MAAVFSMSMAGPVLATEEILVACPENAPVMEEIVQAPVVDKAENKAKKKSSKKAEKKTTKKTARKKKGIPMASMGQSTP